jgi:hypothetical protein
MAKYAELAKQIFQTASGTVSVLLGEQEVMWGTAVGAQGPPRYISRANQQPTEPPKRGPVTEAACSHAVLKRDMVCTAVADLSTDWRFRQNPLLQGMGKKVCAIPSMRSWF